MYTIYFTDNTTFKGGNSLNDTKWNEIPKKQIKYIIFDVVKTPLLFKGFEAYNFVPIKAKGINNKIDCYCELVLMGRFKKVVYKVTFDFMKKEVTKSKIASGKEYNGGRASGWKLGKAEGIPKISELKKKV